MIIDPISDMFVRIRNAIGSKASYVDLPASRLKEAILKIMKQENLITNYQVKKRKGIPDSLVIQLKYDDNMPVIHRLERISKPGLRIYAKANRLPKTQTVWEVVIMSTPQGIMTGKEARKKGVGGEIICRIW